jgi:hypothetical protein
MLLIVALFSLIQGIPVSPVQGGTVTGTLRTATGRPATGVRVAAMVRPDSPQDAVSASSLASIAETDEAGDFKLESVPPGRYYIVAGRIDLPTYYPGSLEMASARDVLISPGATVTGLEFELKDNSVGRADFGTFPGSILPNPNWQIPVRITMEGGARIPVFEQGLFPVLRLTRVSDGVQIQAPLDATSILLPTTGSVDYRVSLENLPGRYTVKSMSSGSTNLLTDPLKVTVPAMPPRVFTLPSFATTVTAGQTNLWSASFVTSVVPMPLLNTIVATLAPSASLRMPGPGVTVSGKVPQPFQRSVYISGTPGTLFADGTFEFHNVIPGRHVILTRDNPSPSRPVGASVVVGEQDLPDLRLSPILESPVDADFRPTSPGNQAPGTVISLASVRGRVLDEKTSSPPALGSGSRVTVNGNTVSYTINAAGEFEIQNLLPGKYNLEIWISGGATYSRSIEIGDENLNLEFVVGVPD